jgi:hypothetical protein
MANWHWLPCLGGRSTRPILERIDFTVKHLIAAEGDISKVPNFDYNVLDLWSDFRHNPGGIFEVGGTSLVDDYPVVEPKGRFPLPGELPIDTKVALIGHSAGGFIARTYLSSRSYGGRIYGGREFVHSLVTLGTPHGNAPGPAFENVKWVNQEESLLVPSLAIGGTGFLGDEWGAFTLGSYTFCSSDGSTGSNFTGDGVTPIQSALAYDGADRLELQNVHHIPWSEIFGGQWVSPELTEDCRNGAPWYGSDGIIDEWIDFIRNR